jgi:CBS domain containing-hemolysin-like protein
LARKNLPAIEDLPDCRTFGRLGSPFRPSHFESLATIIRRMGSTEWLVVAGALLFGGASFFFALAESALMALGKWRAQQMAERAEVTVVLRILEQPTLLLATIVLGNTAANSAIVALVLWPVLLGRWPVHYTLPGVMLFILIGCEVLPKTLAVRAPERWALRVARPMWLMRETTGWLQRWFQRLNAWLLRVFVQRVARPQAAVADEEYQELVELAFQQGTLARSEKEIILQIVSLDRKTVKDVMKPRSQMSAISDELSVEEMIAAARRFKHRRLPIYDETPDTIVGVLNTRALLLRPDGDLADAIEFPSFVPESMNLLQLLKSLQRQRRGLAIVVDEFGGTAGLVALEDILEEVVGHIRHEDEPAGFVAEKLGDGRWRVSGTMRLDDFRREYPELGDVPEVDTMGGLIVSVAEVVPLPGEAVFFRGLKLTAQQADERRVRELLVEVRKR